MCLSMFFAPRHPGSRVFGRRVEEQRASGDVVSRRAIGHIWLDENAPISLWRRRQPSSQPPPRRPARFPLARRKEGSQPNPTPTERKNGPLATNRGTFSLQITRRKH